jgi:hypothetical protein
MALLEDLADALLDVTKPLIDALASPSAFAALLRRNGWRPPPIEEDIAAVSAAFGLGGDVEQAISRLRDLIGNTDAVESELVEAVSALGKLWNDLRALGRPAGALPPPFDRDDFWADFPRDLLQDLFLSYLERARPLLFGPLHLLGVLDETTVPPPPGDRTRVLYSKREVRWDRIPTLLVHPESLAHELYGWGGALDHDRLLGRLERVLLAVRLPAARLPPMHALAARYYPPDHPPPSALRELRVPLFAEHGHDGAIEIGIEVLPVPDEPGGDVRGLAVGPYASGQAAPTMPIGGPFTLGLRGGLQAESAAVLILPGRARASFDSAASAIDAGAALSATPQQPWILLGDENSHRVELADVTLALDLVGAVNDPELKLRLHSGALRIIIDPSEGDSFLQGLFGDQPQPVEVGGDVVWSSKNGLSFGGQAGLRLVVPIHRDFGPAHIDEASIAISASDGGVRVSFALTGGGKLGPVSAVVQDLGLELALTPVQAPARGTFGDVDLALGFKPPSGVGLAIDAAGVSGGGFLFLDQQSGLYTGAVQLNLEGGLALRALGMIATRLPDGSKGFSLLVVITAEDFKPYPLGLGFWLTGIGGLLAINRTFDEQVLREGIQNHTLDSVLFPANPTRDALQLLSNLNKVFPMAPGHHLLGPMAEIEWGTPTLFTMQLGIVLEIGARLRLLVMGQVEAILPKKENDLLRIKMDAVGILDFDQGTASLDAVLYESRLLKKFVLTGAMALRLKWKGAPSFALAIGGLHHAFNPPANFPRLDRIAINLSAGDNPRIICEAYFAVTSNTVQFGARANLYASAHGFSIEGDIGFDVLIQLNPFHFLAEFHASIQLKRDSHNLFMVAVQGALEGPRPLRARGKATFEILWWDVSVSFDKTLVEGDRPPPPPAINVLNELAQALSDRRNWQDALPVGERRVVTVRELQGPNEVRIHPLGKIGVKQTVVPLNLTRDIDKFGSTALSGPRRFSITSVTVGGLAQKSAPLTDFFAPGQFFEMTDDEKIASPSFDTMEAGIMVGADNFTFSSSDGLSVVLTYKTILVDTQTSTPGTRKDDYKLNPDRLFEHARFGAAGRSDVRRTGTAKFQNRQRAPQVAVTKPGFVIASAEDLSPQAVPGVEAGKPMNFTDAQEALRKLSQKNPAEAKKRQVVRAYELVRS